MAGRKNEWTKNCKNEKLTIRKKIKNEKNEWTKKCQDEKIRYEKTRDEKSRNERMRNEKSPTKIGRTKIGPDTKCVIRPLKKRIFFVAKASELCVFKYLAKNNCYPQILSCLFPLEMMQILQLKVDCHFWLCPHFGQ